MRIAPLNQNQRKKTMEALSSALEQYHYSKDPAHGEEIKGLVKEMSPVGK